jgi:Protein of unknown function (DUF2735)
MTTGFNRESAKIYVFPARGRMPVGEPREKARPTADIAALRLPEVTSGSAWYHEDAVRDSEQARKPRS